MSNSGEINHKGTILIIDDEYANLRTLSDMLESEGYDVRGAIDRETAMMIIANDPPDLILLDIKLPETNGYEICEELKKNEETADIPVAFLSVLDDVDDKIKGFRSGGVDYISKPFHTEEVLARVSTHLQLNRLTKLRAEALEAQTTKLNESEKYKTLMTHALDQALERFALIAPDGRYLYVNKKGYDALNYTLEEMLNKRVSDLDPQFSQDQWLAHFEDLKSNGGQTFITSVKDADGHEQKMEIHSTYYNHGSEEFVFSFAWDVTERERLNSKLKEYKHILDNIGNPIAMVDRNYKYRYVNPAYQKIFNLDLEEIIDRSVEDLLGSETFEKQIKHQYQKCFSGHIVNYQLWYETHSLGPRLFEIKYYPFYAEADEIKAVVSNIIDITEKYETEKKLADEEALLEAFLENIPAGIYMKNESDILIFANERAHEMMGKSSEGMIGKTTNDIVDADLADEIVEIDKKILTEQLPGQIMEWEFEEDNRTMFLRDYKFRIGLESGEKILGGAAIDVTELKEKELSLQQALSEIKELKKRLEKENVGLLKELKSFQKQAEIIGESEAIKKCLTEARQVANESTTILVLGETGTGKELLAQAIHDLSQRSNRAMIRVNCAALPANLIESELFGREKGAYTGAMATQRGRFESADGSTIFLDEIGDLPLELQSKLLRVLQEGTFEMLGSNKVVKVDTRIIAATNHDLKELVRKGLFRKDLYYRINVFPIELPPLRKRREDIPLLVWTFIDEFNNTMGKSVTKISDQDMDILKTAEWPGNVRELRNIIERSMILSTGTELILRKGLDTPSITEDDWYTVGDTLSEVERNHILKTLDHTGWRVSGKNGAAAILGLKPTTLEARMKKLNISRPA